MKYVKFIFLLSMLLFIACSSCNGAPDIDDTNGDPSDPGQPPGTPFSTAVEINKKLGRGVNLGATFEGTIHQNRDLSPATLRHYIDEIKEQGFDHVRIPVRWDRVDRSMSNPPYTIDNNFMNQVKSVVDYALSRGLYVILNIHHYTSIFENPGIEKNRFLAQWEQLATVFSEYQERLLFEILNEPSDNLTPALWNQYYKEALEVIRTTPANSKNSKRTVLVGVANYGGVHSLYDLSLPEDDPYVIITVHYYVPFRFTHQDSWIEDSEEWAGTTWDDTEWERGVVIEDFKYAKKIWDEKNIPINVGEFGTYYKVDLSSRFNYANFLSKWFEQQGFSWTYWDFHADFGFYNPNSKTYVQPLLEALTQGTSVTPPRTPSQKNVLYSMNTSQSNSDGWTGRRNNDAASVTTLFSTNSVEMDIKNAGPDLWSIILYRENFPVINGEKYCIKFTASSTSDNQKLQVTFRDRTNTSAVSEDFPFWLETNPKEYYVVGRALTTSENGEIVFYFGGNEELSRVSISDIQFFTFSD